MKIMTVWMNRMAYGLSYEQLNYPPALRELGHQVYSFDISPDESNDDKLLCAVDILRPDIVLFKFYRDEISQETVRHITEKTSSTTVGIFGDDEKYFYKNDKKLRKDTAIVTSEYAPCCDYSVTTHLPAFDWYEKIGVKNVLHMYYCVNHHFYKMLHMKQNYDLSFSGSITPERIRIFNHLLIKDLKVHVFGNGWRGGNESVLDDINYVRLFSKTKVNLNVSVDIINKQRILQIKGRDYEIPMCGGFMLTHYNELLKPCFKFGKEIETYKDNDELVDKIRYYLKNDSKRRNIAKQGHIRALKDHTSVVRLRKLLKQIKIKGKL